MPNATSPNAGLPRPADLEEAGAWLTRHGLVDAQPTALLAVRLAVRRRARIAASVLQALFIMAVALAYTAYGFKPHPRTPLLLLTAVVVALVVALSLLDRWVRRADQRAGATLLRRVAHPARLGWRTVIGWPRAAFAVVSYAGVLGLTAAALAVEDAAGRPEAAVLLVGLAGVAAGTCVQLRHLLAQPAVADDETSLTADAVMRVEDAREVAAPTVLWILPVMSPLTSAPGWWAAWVAFVVLGVGALWLINARTAPSGTVARHAMGAR